ncbi:MAG: GTPase HflX [Patescibacteria group bacterium]|nr:GTPase HflX [Patescibacteria group bacterium]
MAKKALRFLLLQVINPHYHQQRAIRNMAELVQLVTTFGGEILEKSVQHRVNPHPDTYIGPGKVEWLLETVKEKKIDVVVINDLAKSGQLFRLEKTLWKVNTRIAVWDRVDLILNIFDQHATSTEAKLQIELAKIQHKGPRIYGLGGKELSRQGGGIGTRGLGETNIERERRLIKKRTQEIKAELKQRAKVQETRRKQRQQKGIHTVALVGYTSAGKTSLFNALTSKDKEENKALFTTLDTVVGKIKLSKYAPTLLVSDTIGFIDELPPLLIDAFKSTLMESVEARILLHVIDAADPQMLEKVDIVEKILMDLNVKKPPILIFNKIDTTSKILLDKIKGTFPEREKFFVSAKTKQGLSELKQHLGATLNIL